MWPTMSIKKRRLLKKTAWDIWRSAGLSLDSVYSSGYKKLLTKLYHILVTENKTHVSTEVIKQFKQEFHQKYFLKSRVTLQHLKNRKLPVRWYSDASVSISNNKVIAQYAVVGINALGERYIHRESNHQDAKVFDSRLQKSFFKQGLTVNGATQKMEWLAIDEMLTLASRIGLTEGCYSDSLNVVDRLKHPMLTWVPREKNGIADKWASIHNVIHVPTLSVKTSLWMPILKQRVLAWLSKIGVSFTDFVSIFQKYGVWDPSWTKADILALQK